MPSAATAPETAIRAWAFALRDLCEQGAISATVTLDGKLGPVVFSYTRGKGCFLLAGGRMLDMPDEALDAVGYVPAETLTSSSTQSSGDAETTAFTDPPEAA